MRRTFLGAMSVTTVGISVLLVTGCGSAGEGNPSSGMPKVSGLEKTNLTVGAVPVADEAGLYIGQDRGTRSPTSRSRCPAGRTWRSWPRAR
jgi:hypothetical protein